MKYFNYYSILLILLVTACDNYDISSKQAETFVRYYGVGLEDEGMKVITTDEGYLIMANVKNPGFGKDICIITTDEYGNTTAPVTTIGGAFDDVGYTIKPMGEGYIIAGSTQASQGAAKDIYFIQLRADGSVERERTYPYANNNEAYDVYVEEDGELIFTGYTESGDATRQRDILFIKFDLIADSIIHFSNLGIPGADEVAYSVTFWKDSTYMFAGYRRANQETRIIYVVRWTGYGSLSLDLRYPMDGNSHAQTIINSETHGRFFVACNNELSANQSEIWLLETDSTMDVQHVVPTKLGERPINSIYSMTMKGGSLYLCGTSSSSELELGDILLIKLSATGANPTYYYIGDGASYTGRGFDIADDGGYILTGASYLNEKSMIALYKVNNEGNLW